MANNLGTHPRRAASAPYSAIFLILFSFLGAGIGTRTYTPKRGAVEKADMHNFTQDMDKGHPTGHMGEGPAGKNAQNNRGTPAGNEREKNQKDEKPIKRIPKQH